LDRAGTRIQRPIIQNLLTRNLYLHVPLDFPPALTSHIQGLRTDHHEICSQLSHYIFTGLPEADFKIWHGHPVWFLNGNPTVGFSEQKKGIRLMFWSGADFEEPALNVVGGKFKDASIFYTASAQIQPEEISRWLYKATQIQWDYKNIIKRKGILHLNTNKS